MLVCVASCLTIGQIIGLIICLRIYAECWRSCAFSYIANFYVCHVTQFIAHAFVQTRVLRTVAHELARWGGQKTGSIGYARASIP